MTTDKLGPLTVEQVEVTEETGRPKREKSKLPQTPKEALKKTPVSKAIKSSPATRSAKSKLTKSKEPVTKGMKKSSESAEFQEILEEAELITASINKAEITKKATGDEQSALEIKVERDSSGDDSDDHLYDQYDEDEEFDEEFEIEATPSASQLEAGADSTDMSQETTSAAAPTAAKKRKVTTKVKASSEDLEGGGDTPVKVSLFIQ